MRKSKKGFVLFFCLLFILLLPELSKAEKLKVRVISEKATIRLKPDSGSIIIGKAPLGAILESDKQIGEWFGVNLPPDEKGVVVTGYIHSSKVEILTEKPVEEKPVSPPLELPKPPAPPQQPAYQEYRPSPDRGIGFGVKLWGGMNYLSAGDINEGNKGLIDLSTDVANLSGYSVEGKANPVHYGFDFGVDIIINFTPQIGIGIASGYVQGARKSEITLSNATEGSTASKQKLNAVPIRFGLFYNLPINEMMNVVFNIGTGLYFAKYSCNFRLEEDADCLEVNENASANGFGFHGGIGLEYNLAPNVAFVLESQGRYAKIGGFEGKYELLDSSGMSDKDEGILYYYILSPGSPLGKYTLVNISKDEPSGPSISNAREAQIDFSGFTFQAGIKIKF